MKLSPLLDLWEAPDDAGAPVGLVTTTFALDCDFFERTCLARFLGVDAVDEGTGSVQDIVAQLEFEEKLREPLVTVLTDRTTQSERSSLRWDLLACSVPTGGYLHSKISVLLWERATRIIISSANLTPAGYRYNLELAIASDLGPQSLLPISVLTAIDTELRSYLALVPGMDEETPAGRRTETVLNMYRERLSRQPHQRTPLTVEPAPTTRRRGPLDSFENVWTGKRPTEAIHLSPFWDSSDTTVLDEVQALLTGHPAKDRTQRVVTVLGPNGAANLPATIPHGPPFEGFFEMKEVDENLRTLHAKCLVIRSSERVAVLMGSSNHTRAGFGLGGSSRHREFNVWLSAPASSPEGKELARLLNVGSKIAPEDVNPLDVDEDESEGLLTLPPFFVMGRVIRKGTNWAASLTFELGATLTDWAVRLPNHVLLLTDAQWRDMDCPLSVDIQLPDGLIPTYLAVSWPEGESTWTVLVDDRSELPADARIRDLRSRQILDALAAGIPIERILLSGNGQGDTRSSATSISVETDPLKRFDSTSALLKRGRILGKSLDALEVRLSRPATTIETLQGRLKGPLGPDFLTDRIHKDFVDGELGTSEAVFTLAEIALTLSRVPWKDVLRNTDFEEGLGLINNSVDRINNTLDEIEPVDDHLGEYASEALREARSCLSR